VGRPGVVPLAVPVDDVQRLLPDGLRVDTFDGSAWVGLIPFHMRAVRIGPGPIVPYLGSFVEINVRTYVTDADGHRGVWFFSLDVPRSPIVGVARTAFSLPYCWSAAGHTVASTPRRRAPPLLGDPPLAASGSRSRFAPACDIRYTVGSGSTTPT
jgi:uncharacterized protein YqjF (DUF2071 family)